MGTARFDLGQIVSTPGALKAMAAAGTDGLALLGRHIRGDWGEVGAEDASLNEVGVKHGLRILSVYTLGSGVKLWIITEADRSATTFLLPEEY